MKWIVDYFSILTGNFRFFTIFFWFLFLSLFAEENPVLSIILYSSTFSSLLLEESINTNQIYSENHLHSQFTSFSNWKSTPNCPLPHQQNKQKTNIISFSNSKNTINKKKYTFNTKWLFRKKANSTQSPSVEFEIQQRRNHPFENERMNCEQFTINLSMTMDS